MTARVRAFIRRDVQLAASYPSTLVMPFAGAFVTVAGFAMLSRIVSTHAPLDAGSRHVDYFTYVVVNLAFMLLLNAALQAVPAALRRDQVAGTLEAMLASPTPLGATVAASAAWPMIFASLQVLAYIGFAAALGLHLDRFNAPLLLEFSALGIACAGAIGLLFAAAVIAFKQLPPFSLMAGTAATLLAGALFPVALLPAPLRAVSWLLPLTHALRGLRAAAAGAPAISVTADAVWLAVAACVLVPAGLAALHWSIDYAKSDGSLSTY